MNNNKISFSKTHVLFLYNKDNLNQFMNKCLFSKYFVNTETYNKLFINQLLHPKTRRHIKYKEYLIVMDVKEFIKKYYNMSRVFQKLNLLLIANSLLVKPAPNFLNMDSIYVLMQKNLKEKQFILNDYYRTIKKIKQDITTTGNKYHFLNNYCDSFNNIFESKDSLINEHSKQFNSRFYIDPQDKEDSIIFIENLIQYIEQTNIKPMPKEQNENYNNKNNLNGNIETLVKLTPKFKISKKNTDKSRRIGAISTLMQKLSSYEHGFKGILRRNTHSKTISDKKGIPPFEKESPQPKRKQSDVILMQGNSLFNSKLQKIIFDIGKNNKQFQTNNSTTITDKSISKKRFSDKQFLSTKVFFGRLKEKRNKKIKLFIKQPLRTMNVTSSTTKQNTNNISVNTSHEFITERSHDHYKNKIFPFSNHLNTINFSSVNNNNNKNKVYIQHCKTDFTKYNKKYLLKELSSNECSFNNEVIKSSIQQYFYKNVIPKKTILRNNRLTHRNYKSSLHNNGNSLYSSNNSHRIYCTSNNNLNYYKTSSNLSSSLRINKDNTERNNSLNYCLSINNKRKVKNLALFLRKEKS